VILSRAAAKRSVGDADFVAYARAAVPRMCRTAFLMCRDWHLAEDLTQATLAKMYVAWPRISHVGNLMAYSRKMLFRALLDHRRRRRAQEVVTDRLPDRAAGAPRPDLRLTLIDALARLPDRDRAIVVLRYWEDHSVETVAEMLEVSASVVKQQSLRSLHLLRDLLGDARPDLFADELS
jgi:RNA polymerase sigma-70 factor (sigma-E family)